MVSGQVLRKRESHRAIVARAILFIIAVVTIGCGKSGSASSQMTPPASESSYSPQPYTGKMEPDDGQWVRPAKDYASTRYSSLDQINTNNAKNLQVSWTFSTGMDRGHEAAPLYVNGSLYIITPWPNTLFALDAKTGALKWQYNPNPSPSSKGVACCLTRSIAVAHTRSEISTTTRWTASQWP